MRTNRSWPVGYGACVPARVNVAPCCLERVPGIEPALSAWESVRLRPSTWPDLRVGVSASDRERPLVAGANCTLIARRSQGCGVPRAGAGKILPRPRRTVGGEKAGRPEPYTGGTGARAPAWTVLQVLVALVLVVSPYRRECATLPWRFIRRAPRLVNDLRPERDSNAGPTALEVVSHARVNCCFPGESRSSRRLATA